MFNWLRGHFMPHEGNSYQPHFLRSENTKTLVIVLLVSQALFFIFTFFVIPNSKQVAAIIVSTLVEQTNSERLKIKLGTLTQSELLKKSAQLKADDMAEKGYFSHNTPDGKNPWFFFNKVNYKYQFAGENLAVNFVDSKDVTDAWMNSKTHRDNLLNSKYTEVGISTALGKYKGRDAIFIVQHFGKPISSISLKNDNIINTSLVQNAAKTNGNNNVLGAQSEQKIAPWSMFISLTSKFNISVELAIALLSLISLLIAILVKIKIQHPIIIANGVIIISIAALFILINTIITQGTI